MMLKKKIMAYWGAVCPGCNIGRKYPNSFIGKRVVEHWQKGCPVNEAYVALFRANKENEQKKQEVNAKVGLE